MGFQGETICSVHDEIKKSLNEIQKIKTKHYESIDDYKYDVDYEISNIEDLVEKAKEMGQRMENCIIERREAINEAINELQTIVISNLRESL